MAQNKVRNFTRKFLAPLAGVLVAGALIGNAGAAVIAYQGFDSFMPENATGAISWGYTISGVTGGGSFAPSNATGTGNFPENQRILEGTHSLQVNNASGIVTFDTVDVSMYTDVYLIVRLTGNSATSGNGVDAPDYLRLFTAVNGAAFATGTSAAASDISLTGLANAKWGYNAALVGSTTAGTNKILTTSPVDALNPDPNNYYSTLRIDFSSDTTELALRLAALTDNAGEFWNIDGITLHGTLVPEPSKAVLLLLGCFGLLWRRRR